eukprot:274647_1
MDDLDPNENNELNELRQELLQLEQWKEDIGIPAQQEKEQLLIECELLKEQNRTIVSEITLYKQEIDKLKKENKDLSEEADRYSATSLEAARVLKAKEQELSKLYTRCTSLESDVQKGQQQIGALTRQCNDLQKRNEQYCELLVNLQKQEVSLKDKVHEESVQLSELQGKYLDLTTEFRKQNSVMEESVQLADELSAEMHDLEEYVIKNDDEDTGHIVATKTLVLSAASLATLRRDNPQSIRNNTWYDMNGDTTRTLPGDTVITDPSLLSEEVVNYIKEEMQIEADEMYLAQISELHEQIVQYKKKMIVMNNELRKCQTIATNGGDGTSNRRQSASSEQNIRPHRSFLWDLLPCVSNSPSVY